MYVSYISIISRHRRNKLSKKSEGLMTFFVRTLFFTKESEKVKLMDDEKDLKV